MKTLKVEGIYPLEFETAEDVVEQLPAFIEKYNARRLHSSLGCLSPEQCEKQHTPGRRSKTPPNGVRPEGSTPVEGPVCIQVYRNLLAFGLDETAARSQMPYQGPSPGPGGAKAGPAHASGSGGRGLALRSVGMRH